MNSQKNIYQPVLLTILFVLMAISLFSIYNAQQFDVFQGEHYVWKQFAWFILGAVAIYLIQLLDLSRIYAVSLYLYLFGLLLLVLLFFAPSSIAPVINGAKSWFIFGPFSFQPAEFTKITTIVYLAAVLSSYKVKTKQPEMKEDLLLLLKLGLAGLLPAVFVILQPDLGTFMVYIGITAVLILLSGINWKIIFRLVAFFLLSIGIALLLILFLPGLSQTLLNVDPYQINRIETWLQLSERSDDQAYQISQSLAAFRSGGLTGKGIGNAEVYIPEAPTDFIFAVTAESFGFIGGLLVILLYFLLLTKLMMTGRRMLAVNAYAAYLCFGYGALIFIHVFQNIGMTLGIMPITGIPLLFISYGGSSVVAAMIGFGLIYLTSRQDGNQRIQKIVKRRSEKHPQKERKLMINWLFVLVCLSFSALLFAMYRYMIT